MQLKVKKIGLIDAYQRPVTMTPVLESIQDINQQWFSEGSDFFLFESDKIRYKESVL